MYTYAPLTPDHYDAIYALWASIPGIGLSEADSREAIGRYLDRNPGQSFICCNGDEIIGTILCGNDGRRAYIHHTAVLPEHRCQGIAAELVRMALAVQRAQGMRKCHLFIFNENEGGKAFWKQAGFSTRIDIEIMSTSINP